MPMKKHLTLLLLILTVGNAFGQNCDACKKLEIIEAVKKGFLSPDLALVDVNARILACPQYLQGDSTLCSPAPQITKTWDAQLPNDLIWTLFFSKKHYEHCKDIFRNDFFQASMANIPEPTDDALDWFMYRWHYFTSLLPIDDTVPEYTDISELEMVQRKMISVFFRIKSWTYCPEQKVIGGNFTVHGVYDKEHNIVLYKNACLAKQIYKSNINNLALAFKFHFVGAHELSHAIDDLNGSLNYETDESRIACELSANVNGLIMTKAICRLFNAYFGYYKVKVYENLETAKLCDTLFINNIVNDWRDVESLFNEEISKAQKRIGAKTPIDKLKKEEWSEWGCIEQL